MEDPRLLVKRSRDALARTEAAFSKVQSIGKAGNDRCTKLTDKLAAFSASYESCREEVNAALALVEAQGVGASNASSSRGGQHGGAGADSTAEVAVHEAMELEAAAAHELKHARDANLDFQRQRKAVRDLVVDAWDQLVAIAKSVEEADKLALRALSEWDAGDEKKAVKYADKASRKADRSYKCAIETERALANIMAGLKEGRTALHAAESHLSSGSVKAEQARSVALGAWEALGLLPPPPPPPHATRQRPFTEHSSRHRERRPRSRSPDRHEGAHSSSRPSKPSSSHPHSTTATESPASGSSAGHSGSSHAHSSSSNYDSDNGSQLQRTRETVNVMRPAALEGDQPPWPGRNSSSSSRNNHRSPVDLEWEAAFEKETAALKEARELAQDEVALAELRRQRAALDTSFNANEVARQAADGLNSLSLSSGRSNNSSSNGGGDFSDTGSQHSRTSSGHGSGTSSSRPEKRAYKSKSVAAMVTSLASREAKLEQKVQDRKAANRARFLAAAVARNKAQASASAASAAVSVTSPQSADTLESNLSSNSNNTSSRRPFIPFPAARDEAESQALAAHYFGLAGELEDEDLLAEAADAYAASLQHQPAQAEGHYNLAIILDALGRFDESVASSLSASALKPQWPEAHYNLGQTYDSIGDIRRAVACYEAAVALKPGWDDAVHNLAVVKHELAAQPELEAVEPQQASSGAPSTPERPTQANSPNGFVSPVAYSTPPPPLPPGVLGGGAAIHSKESGTACGSSGSTSAAQQLFSSPSSSSSPAPPPMYTPFGSTPYSNSNTTASSALFNSAGAFYDNHSDDDSENPDEGEWDLESATSSKSGTASDAGSQHSDVSFWSAASHASKATSHRSSSNKHSHGRGVSTGRHGSSPLPAMPPTPPREQPAGRGFSISYDAADDSQRHRSSLGAALDEASENDDDNPMSDKKNCLLS